MLHHLLVHWQYFRSPTTQYGRYIELQTWGWDLCSFSIRSNSSISPTTNGWFNCSFGLSSSINLDTKQSTIDCSFVLAKLMAFSKKDLKKSFILPIPSPSPLCSKTPLNNAWTLLMRWNWWFSVLWISSSIFDISSRHSGYFVFTLIHE